MKTFSIKIILFIFFHKIMKENEMKLYSVESIVVDGITWWEYYPHEWECSSDSDTNRESHHLILSQM